MNEAQNTRHQRILIIDDNTAIHEDFRKIFITASASENALADAGAALFGEPADPGGTQKFQLDSAYQGEEGITLVQAACAEDLPYAMAFVDVRMPPGLDGIETASRLWQLDPRMQIVICTAYSDYSWDEMIAKLPRADQLLILKKPFDSLEVMQMAHALTEKWRLHEAAKFNLEFVRRNVEARTRVLEAQNAKLETEVKRLEDALRERTHRLEPSA